MINPTLRVTNPASTELPLSDDVDCSILLYLIKPSTDSVIVGRYDNPPDIISIIVLYDELTWVVKEPLNAIDDVTEFNSVTLIFPSVFNTIDGDSKVTLLTIFVTKLLAYWIPAIVSSNWTLVANDGYL